MTRQEFIEDVTTWSELIDFCYNEGIDYCDDVYSEESYNERIDERVRDYINDDGWRSVLGWLEDLPLNYDYYIEDDYGEWRGADDDDFDSYKDDVLEYMDDNDEWDEDEDEEEEAPYEYHDPEDDIPVEEEDISVAELFTACSSTVQKLESDKIADAAAAEQAEAIAFDELCVSVGITVTVEGSN